MTPEADLHHDPFDGENKPPALLQRCLRYLTENPETICNKTNLGFELKNEILLPGRICDLLLAEFNRRGATFDDGPAFIFKDKGRTRLSRVCINKSKISDEALAMLIQHELEILDLRECWSVSLKSLDSINRHGDKLRYLFVGSGILREYDPRNSALDEDVRSRLLLTPLNSPNLECLTIHDMPRIHVTVFQRLLRPLTNLRYLDLSGCLQTHELAISLRSVSMIHLASLTLHNAKYATAQAVVDAICSFKSLETLDISQIKRTWGNYVTPDIVLARIVENLPKLKSLDISGTNLAGAGVANQSSERGKGDKAARSSDIVGLSCRVEDPLEFLGLYRTDHDACHRHDIPAKLVSGNANEYQLATAALRFIDTPCILYMIFKELHARLQNGSISNALHVLTVILKILDRNITNRSVFEQGCGIFSCILRTQNRTNLSTGVKRHIISTFLNAMDAFADHYRIIEYGLLVLSHLELSDDVLFQFKRMIKILISTVTNKNQDDGTRTSAMSFLHIVTRDATKGQETIIGELGLLSRMLEIIRIKLAREEFDVVLDRSWLVVWHCVAKACQNNTPEDFLNQNGMDLFLCCFRTARGRIELMQSMAGLIGNIVVTKQLRYRIMHQSYIKAVYDLVNFQGGNNKVSCNAAEILSYLVSDGPESWTVASPTREAVLRRIVEAVDTWDLHMNRGVSYPSLEPMLRLLQTHRVPECQYWAVWVLANLTYTFPNEFCCLLEGEGTEILQKLIVDDAPYPKSKDLALTILAQCRARRQGPNAEV